MTAVATKVSKVGTRRAIYVDAQTRQRQFRQGSTRERLAFVKPFANVTKLGRVEHGKGTLGLCHVSYSTQLTCPDSCRLNEWRHNEDGSRYYYGPCYGNQRAAGNVVHTANDLNKAIAHGDTPEDAARQEAACIDATQANAPMRLHEIGDCQNDVCAWAVSSSAMAYMARAENPDATHVWTYTHAWADTARESWQGVSVLASVHDNVEADLATERGYACAVVVEGFERPTAYDWHGYKLIPCPQQTGKAASCYDCRLCWNDTKLRQSRSIIGFEAHGAKAMTIDALRKVNLHPDANI